jgi:hypothetical protein
MKTYSVNGFWHDDGARFDGYIVAAGVWDGVTNDDDIFYYLEGAPVLGDHGEFTIVEVTA